MDLIATAIVIALVIGLALPLVAVIALGFLDDEDDE